MSYYQLIIKLIFRKSIENNDITVPLILWLQGGPGCWIILWLYFVLGSDWYSSDLEMGPYKIRYNSSTQKYNFIENEYTWALDNYLLFMD